MRSEESQDVECGEFELVQSAMSLLTEMEEKGDNDSQRLSMARSHLSSACQSTNGSVYFDREFAEAVGLIASEATERGYDEISEAALELGAKAESDL